MTEFEIKHGLSQDAPGPLGLEAPDGTPARTGNTARDQEMYAAGPAVGEENAKHNAAIRGGVPDGWKLVPIKPTEAMLDAGCRQHRCEQGDPWYPSHDLDEGDCRDIYAAMLNAAAAAPVCPTCNNQGAVGNILTAQPCPDCAAPASPVSITQDGMAPHDVLLSVWNAMQNAADGNDLLSRLEHMRGSIARAVSAPAAGDALSDPPLQKLFGEVITGALGFGAQGVNPPPAGHWLEPFWKMARADAALANAPAILDHPLIREVLGYIEDAGPADVWGAAQSWMALRDAALSAAQRQGDA